MLNHAVLKMLSLNILAFLVLTYLLKIVFNHKENIRKDHKSKMARDIDNKADNSFQANNEDRQSINFVAFTIDTFTIDIWLIMLFIESVSVGR